MIRYILGRLASLLFVLFAVSIINFSIMHAVPGGPFDEDKQPLPPAAKANILRKYGLDKPLWQQYLNYMSHVIRFDFGIPYQQPTSTVTKLIAEKWPITAQVGLMTLTLVFGLGITLGLVAAYNQNSWLDNALTFFAMLGITMPNFVLAFMLLLTFAVRLDWLPMRGWGDSACLIKAAEWSTGYFCTDWILPVIAYALAPVAVVARFTRASVIDTIRSDYVRTARAKGLGERVMMTRHVLRNALIPLVTIAGPMIPDIMTGSIFIESTFAINGLGKYFVTSAFNRDYPMIMAISFLIAGLWGFIYLMTDIVYTWIDPRIRLGGRGS
ncbi:MAG: ABC transporter permease [Caldilineaceae bacterium]|nr:ABC transporter permease [Caldilineaceae bacterium]